MLVARTRELAERDTRETSAQPKKNEFIQPKLSEQLDIKTNLKNIDK